MVVALAISILEGFYSNFQAVLVKLWSSLLQTAHTHHFVLVRFSTVDGLFHYNSTTPTSLCTNDTKPVSRTPIWFPDTSLMPVYTRLKLYWAWIGLVRYLSKCPRATHNKHNPVISTLWICWDIPTQWQLHLVNTMFQMKGRAIC